MNELIFSKTEMSRTTRENLDLPNDARKADSKTATDLDRSKFAQKVDLTDLKSNVDKLNIDKLRNVPTTLSNF